MRCSVTLLLALAFSACGSADAPETPPAQAASIGDRQSLSGHQLGALLPEQVGAFALVPETTQFGDSRVDAEYRTEDRQISVSVADLADTPEFRPRHQERLRSEATEVSNGPRTTRYLSVASAQEGEALVWRATEENGVVNLHALVADRFVVQTWANNISLADLDAFWSASGFADLGSTPYYADAGPDEPPAWAVGATPSVEEPEPGEFEVTVADGPVLTALPACDTLLPVSAVEQACGVTGVRVVATDFEQTGQNCNRVYKRGDGSSSGLILLVSKFADVATAGRALGVSVDVDDREDLRSLGNLGGLSFRHYDNHIATFAKGNVLVELKASDGPLDQPNQKLCRDATHLASLAEGVATRLAE